MSGSNIGSGLGNYRGLAKHDMPPEICHMGHTSETAGCADCPFVFGKYAPKLSNYRGLAKLTSVTVDENTMIALHGEDTMEIFKTAIHKLAIEIERGTAEPRAEYDEAIERLNAQGTEARRAETAKQGSVHDGPVGETDAPTASRSSQREEGQ